MLHSDQTAPLQYVGEPEQPTIETDWQLQGWSMVLQSDLRARLETKTVKC